MRGFWVPPRANAVAPPTYKEQLGAAKVSLPPDGRLTAARSLASLEIVPAKCCHLQPALQLVLLSSAPAGSLQPSAATYSQPAQCLFSYQPRSAVQLL